MAGMAGKEKTGKDKAVKAGKGDKPKRQAVTKSTRSGLQFPVARMLKQMKKNRYAAKTHVGAAVFLASVLEYITAEVLELSGNAALDNKRKRIKPRHILFAVRSDDELGKLMKGVTISEGGVIPHIEPALLVKPKKNGKKSQSQSTTA